MIVDALVSILTGLLTFIAGLIPGGTVPAWFTGLTDDMETWIGYTAGLGAWIPLGLMLNVFGALLSCYVIGFTIRLVRIIASFFTAGGGAAG
jgi:hypothetical protein